MGYSFFPRLTIYNEFNCYTIMEIARHWRLRRQRLNLEGEICENGHPVFPPRDICPDCHGEAETLIRVSNREQIVYDCAFRSPVVSSSAK